MCNNEHVLRNKRQKSQFVLVLKKREEHFDFNGNNRHEFKMSSISSNKENST